MFETYKLFQESKKPYLLFTKTPKHSIYILKNLFLGAQTLRVATTYIHHNHNSQTLDNDIALLKLHGEAELKVCCFHINFSWPSRFCLYHEFSLE